MTAKELFHKDKQLLSKWTEIAHSDDFEKVLVFARAQFMLRPRTAEEMAGAQAFITTLTNLPEPEPAEETWPTLLEHDLDNPIKQSAT